MYRLIYISTVASEVGDIEVDRILATSRLRNAASGITGLLIYDGVRFLQYLEGEEADVTATFGRIKCDPRHRGVVELWVSMGNERQFPQWTMASRRVDDGADLGDAVAEMTRQCDPRIAVELLSFARLRDRVA